MDRLPPKYETVQVTKYRTVERDTGRSECEYDKKGKLKCKPVIISERVPYLATVQVDKNKERRDVLVTQCTATACNKKYGNPQCKIPK